MSAWTGAIRASHIRRGVWHPNRQWEVRREAESDSPSSDDAGASAKAARRPMRGNRYSADDGECHSSASSQALAQGPGQL